MKAAKQDDVIKSVREDISRHWEYCGYPDDQKAKFTPFKQNPLEDENILKKHQAYLERLKAEFEAKKPILLLIQKYKQLAKSRQELFDMENNVNNNLSERRRSSAVQALETSKLTATVTKDMPRCLQKLVQAIKAAEANPVELADGRKVRKPFMYMGERYLATLDRQEKEFKKMKEQFRDEREKRKMEKRVGGTAAQPKLGFDGAASIGQKLLGMKKRATTRIEQRRSPKVKPPPAGKKPSQAKTNSETNSAKKTVAVTRVPTSKAAGVSPKRTPTKSPMGVTRERRTG